MTMRADQLTEVVTHHGEGPVWAPEWEGPRFVDMLAGDICELRTDCSIGRVHIGAVAAMIRPRARGGFVVAGERGLLLAAAAQLDAPLQALPEIFDDASVRMNEGGCDPAGNLYLGSMAYDSRPDGGALYRIFPDGTAETVDDTVTISNGIDWSPDGHICYYVDSATHRIDQFDWTPHGLAKRRPLTRIEGPGIPDGLTVDAEGNIWTAIFGGGQIRCYTPAGALVEVVELPCTQVTAVTFTGAELADLIMTTSREGLGDHAEPAAGALFTVRPGVSGRPTTRFTG